MTVSWTSYRPQYCPGVTSSRDNVVSASVAHDLCNHLQLVTSALSIIQRSIRSDANSVLDAAFSGAQVSLERAAKLSRGLANDSCSQGALAARMVLADRLPAMRETVLLACGPNIRIELSIGENVPDVHCSATSLENALLNLVVNAARAMPNGGRLSISATREEAVAGSIPYAAIRVADTGCGMSPDVVERAFEPRFTTPGAGEGSGIGLAAVAHFANSAGGSVELASRQGVGTMVTIRLPGIIKMASTRDCTDEGPFGST